MKTSRRLPGLAALTFAGVAGLLATMTPAAAWDRGNVDTFAVLPAGAPKIEGLTVGDDGNVYVSTFDPTGTSPDPTALLFVFDGNNGHLVRRVPIVGSSKATLGLAFHPSTHKLL